MTEIPGEKPADLLNTSRNSEDLLNTGQNPEVTLPQTLADLLNTSSLWQELPKGSRIVIYKGTPGDMSTRIMSALQLSTLSAPRQRGQIPAMPIRENFLATQLVVDGNVVDLSNVVEKPQMKTHWLSDLFKRDKNQAAVQSQPAVETPSPHKPATRADLEDLIKHAKTVVLVEKKGDIPIPMLNQINIWSTEQAILDLRHAHFPDNENTLFMDGADVSKPASDNEI